MNVSKMHVSFSGKNTPSFKPKIKTLLRLLRTNGRRGCFKGLSKLDSFRAAKLALPVIMKEQELVYQKALEKMLLKYWGKTSKDLKSLLTPVQDLLKS